MIPTPANLRSIYKSEDGVSALGMKTHKITHVQTQLLNGGVRDIEASDIFVGAHSVEIVPDEELPHDTAAFPIADMIVINGNASSLEFKMEAFPDELCEFLDECDGVENVASVTITFTSRSDMDQLRGTLDSTSSCATAPTRTSARSEGEEGRRHRRARVPARSTPCRVRGGLLQC